MSWWWCCPCVLYRPSIPCFPLYPRHSSSMYCCVLLFTVLNLLSLLFCMCFYRFFVMFCWWKKKNTQIELKLNWIFYPGIICDIYRAMNNKYFENKNIYIYEELYFIKKIKGKNCCRIKGKLMRLLQRVRVYITGIVLLNLV